MDFTENSRSDAPDLRQLLSDITRIRIAVIGDFCLDAYWFMDLSASEVSLETRRPTRPVARQRYSPGGAGNVVRNLVSMGAKDVSAFGVIGEDPFGYQIQRLLEQDGVDYHGLLVQQPAWSTHVYSKPYVRDEEENRIDFGDFNRLEDDTARNLVAVLESHLDRVDLVIINEQVVSGIHASPLFRSLLSELIARHRRNRFLLDSRHNSESYPGALRKINDNEAARLCGIPRASGQLVLLNEARQAAEALYRRWGTPLFITRGPRGCIACDEAGVREIPGLQILGRTDTVGAGDSMLAGIAAALAAGRDCVTAATFGNFVAAVTVQKLFQTGSASPQEIFAIGSDPDYIYRPELAEDPRQARYLDPAEIEIITDLPKGVHFTHVILDHDGTLSTIRQGWEHVMEPMMIRAILGDRYEAADESLYQDVVKRVRSFIDATTGIQTLAQMEGLVGMVKEFGCVPADRILDAPGYKKMYSSALMEVVSARMRKLEAGELDVADLTVKNAPLLLHALRDAGMRLFLASGSDREDVIREAGVLGYASCFEGRIYGSVGRSSVEAKKIVLEQILNDIGAENASHLIVFGDGPVEIRETHKRGGYAVGVASDEVRRFGLNAEKRARLVRAGSDIIVPDFSQLAALFAALGIPYDAH
jgi:rfaE bifunctional protein kinase chain/domain